MATLRTIGLTKTYNGRTVVRGVNLDVAASDMRDYCAETTGNALTSIKPCWL